MDYKYYALAVTVSFAGLVFGAFSLKAFITRQKISKMTREERHKAIVLGHDLLK